ncbi:MAG: hypothetical protein K6A45_05410 [Lachnospiraceae bacterium]|nr:hypothetical protein [Lachnospiraceae bacterium]
MLNDNEFDEYLRQGIKEAIDSIPVSEEEKTRVISLAIKNKEHNGDDLQEKRKVVSISRKMSKTAAIIITAIFVLVISGGIAWAMSASGLKDFFFKDNDRSFETVYMESGREYDFGEYKVSFTGYAYDGGVGRGYLQFGFTDISGNPLDISTMLEYDKDIRFDRAKSELTRKTSVNGYTLGDQKIVFLFMNTGSRYTVLNGSDMLVKFKAETKDFYSEPEPVRFLVLSGEEWKKICEEIDAINEDDVCNLTYDPDRMVPVYYYDIDSMQSEVVDILEKYVPVDIISTTKEPQYIETGGLKITVGRMDILFEYNIEECDVKCFTLRRKDGTELVFRRNDDETWSVEGVDNTKTYQGGGRYGEKVRLDYTMGFVLGPEEKVEIDIK